MSEQVIIDGISGATTITDTTHAPLVVSLGLYGDPGPHAGAPQAVNLKRVSRPSTAPSAVIVSLGLDGDPGLGLDGDSGPHAGASVKCSVEKVLQFQICNFKSVPAGDRTDPITILGDMMKRAQQ